MKLLFIFCLISTFGIAQQEPLTSQFWNQYAYYNPAMTGIEYKHQAAINYRYLIDDLTGPAELIYANYNVKLNAKHALGVNFNTAQYIANSNYSGAINYSYRLLFNEEKAHFLSFGIGLGVGRQNYDYDKFIFPTTSVDPFFLPKRTTYPRLNLGVAYHWKKLFLGAGATQITGDLSLKSGYKPVPHYFAMASYQFIVSSKFDLLPRVMYRTDAIVQSADLNLMGTFNKKYSLGIGTRNFDVLILLAQYDIFEKFRIGYSFDYSRSNLNNGSSIIWHEIVLGFQLK